MVSKCKKIGLGLALALHVVCIRETAEASPSRWIYNHPKKTTVIVSLVFGAGLLAGTYLYEKREAYGAEKIRSYKKTVYTIAFSLGIVLGFLVSRLLLKSKWITVYDYWSESFIHNRNSLSALLDRNSSIDENKNEIMQHVLPGFVERMQEIGYPINKLSDDLKNRYKNIVDLIYIIGKQNIVESRLALWLLNRERPNYSDLSSIMLSLCKSLNNYKNQNDQIKSLISLSDKLFCNTTEAMDMGIGAIDRERSVHFILWEMQHLVVKLMNNTVIKQSLQEIRANAMRRTPS